MEIQRVESAGGNRFDVDTNEHFHESSRHIFGDRVRWQPWFDRPGSHIDRLLPAAAQLTLTTHASGQYAFTVTGSAGCNYVVQASTDLLAWVSLQTNAVPFTFVDTNAANFPQRYYRSFFAP